MSSPVRKVPLQEGLPAELTDLPMLILHVIEVDETPLPEGELVAFIRYSRLEDRVLLGCETKQIPVFSPDIDFRQTLTKYSTTEVGRIVSRQHLVLGLSGGTPIVTHLAQRGDTTWIDRQGRLIPVRREPTTLQHRDILILGVPDRRSVRIRVEFVLGPA